ncbi:uncharacterized protein [Diabrotica undecimpunctata]|uniref:uncharacterized protein n=1 Tax=Diabrotica undecimpunctata TaxID=50387 RepID=UPI003B63C1EA
MMADKAVSTEDLCGDQQKVSVAVSLVRLEAILQTLIENKVEALRNESRKTSSIHSSQKSILKRLRLTSTSSQSTTKEENEKERGKKTAIVNTDLPVKHDHVVEVEKVVRKSALKKESSISSASTIQQCACRMPSFEVSSLISDDDRNRAMQYDNIYMDGCSSLTERPPSCYCNPKLEGQTIHYDEDYISLKIDPDKPSPIDDLLAEEALYRARRKRRKRRKKELKKRMAMAQNTCFVEGGELNETFKHLTVEDSSKRAKWTIVATAFLLLFMCLLLVGITLRMAPIIDEMVRKENEEFVNSLTRHRNVSAANSVHLNHT